ncbi:MAG: hypothetical protein FWE43_02950 [Streptococcaceae bacterium]|nr:hypothetical protein [Streptococcaceae bacterium]MCL2681421.1 hypothetical protein [Streptococcaceae bacterium]
MFIEKETLLRVMLDNVNKTLTFRFYDPYSSNDVDVMAMECIVPIGSMDATYEHEPTAHVPAMKLVYQEWEDIAYFALDGEVICERKAKGLPMRAKSEDVFLQPEYDQFVIDTLQAEATGREVVVADLTESGAGSLMRGFAAQWEQYKKENNLIIEKD